ncbi:MAG: serine hydrolase [Oscillospiraceae bacterium]|nr:serine hydrolase [Oscillospiraceae bacterium]
MICRGPQTADRCILPGPPFFAAPGPCGKGGSAVIDENAVRERLAALPGRIGFYCKNLVTGETLSCGADTPMMAASVIKLFVLAEAERRMDEGTLDRDALFTVRHAECVPSCGALNYMHDGLQVTIGDLCTLMIIHSDNSATNFLIDLLGFDAINALIRSLGYSVTALNRKMFDLESSARGIQNYICAAEVGDLLERMYRGTLVSPAASADMLRIMRDQQINHKIPFYLSELPDPPEIAHKTGEDDGITHDAGIVYADEPFVVVFCGNETDVPAFARAIGELSLELYRGNAK